MKNDNLKDTVAYAVEFYERQAERMRKRMERVPEGSSIQRETRDAYEFNRGRANAMSEALLYIEQFIG